MDLIHTLFEPAGEGPHPTIIALHGWGANALDLLGLAPYIAGGKFMVICPQGPSRWISARSRDTDGSRCGWDSAPREDQVEEAVERAGKFIDAAIARYPVNPRKLVILGFSQGGMMSFRLAFRQPERYAALVGLSTGLPSRVEEQRYQSRCYRKTADAHPAWTRR